MVLKSSRRKGLVLGISAARAQAAERRRLRVVAAGREQAIGQRLGEHVGELFGRLIRYERLLERLAQIAQHSGGVIGRQRVDDDAADEVREAGQALGQFARIVDRRRRMGEEGS